MILGDVDYGLIGVVGGMTAFITYFNGVMASGVGRFYAISAGSEAQDLMRGIEKCREWFTVAVIIHTVLPVMLLVFGYPIGEWAVRHFLTIPPDRIEGCVWVWRFSCLSCFVSMISVPFHGMYGAKQEIAELTIYSFVTSTVNVFFLYYALTHPSDWLVRFSAWMCALSVVPSLIIIIRAVFKYPECRFRWMYVRCWHNIKKMMQYSGWLLVGNLAAIFSAQGVSIFVNKLFGPRLNAATNVGNALTGQCQALSGSMIGAFSPAIMNAYGAGDTQRFLALSHLVNKIATLLILVFAIPLSLEIDEVLHLWLKNPPAYAAGFCILGLVYAVVDKISWGCCISVYAVGKMALYETVIGGAAFLVIPLSYIFYKLGFGIYCAAWALIGIRVFIAVARVAIARHIVGSFSILRWLANVVAPVCAVSSVCMGVGCVPKLFLSASLFRVCLTTVLVEMTLFLFVWHVMFTSAERAYFGGRVMAFWGRLARK